MKYGVPDVDLFQTTDLFDRKNIALVTTTVFAVGRAVGIIKFGFILFLFLIIFSSLSDLSASRVAWPVPGTASFGGEPSRILRGYYAGGREHYRTAGRNEQGSEPVGIEHWSDTKDPAGKVEGREISGLGKYNFLLLN